MWSMIFVPHWGQNFFAISGKSSNCMIWRNSFARFGGGRDKRTRNDAANRAIFPESPLVKFAKILTVGKHRSPGVRQKGCRVPPARVRAGSRSRRRRSGLPSRSCGHGKACKEPASWIRPRTVFGRHDGG